MADPTYTVRATFANPVVEKDILHVTYRRSISSVRQGFRAGECTIVLDNMDAAYSPENPQSSYTGLLTVNQSLSIEALTDAGSTYMLFSGFIDRFTVNPSLYRRVCTVHATDASKPLFIRKITTPLFTDIKVSSLVTDVLSISDIASADMTIDAISDQISYASFSDERPIDVINRIMKFGKYTYFMGPDRKVNFRSRYFGLGGTVSNSYDGNATGFFDLKYKMEDRNVINHALVGGNTYKQFTTVETVAWLEKAVTVDGSGSAGFWLDYHDPDSKSEKTIANSMVTPVSSSDFLANTSEDGTGTDKTATTSVQVTFYGMSAVCSVFNGDGSEIYLTKFQLRGSPVQIQPEFRMEYQDSSSEAVYGRREFTLVEPLIDSPPYASDYASFMKDEWKEPIADIGFTLKNEFPDILQREVGDIIHIVESNTAISSIWSVTNMTHTISFLRGLEHKATYNLDFWKDKKYLTLDDAVFGVLDGDRVLAF